MTYQKEKKGAAPHYLQFLWRDIANIRTAESYGDYATAIKLAATLIKYLPLKFKKEFTEKATQIRDTMDLIASGNVPQIKDITDPFIRNITKGRILNTYGYEAVEDFLSKFTSILEQDNYLIYTRSTQRGTYSGKY